MNKKATLTTIIAAVVLFAFLILIIANFLFPGSILDMLGKGGGWIADNTLLGLRQNQAKTEITAFQDTDEAYDGILIALRKEGEGPCIFRYNQLPDNFDSEIVIDSTPQGAFIQLKNKQDQILRRETVSGRVPCAIAGQAAENFFKNYLDIAKCGTVCPKDYNEAQKIELKEAGKINVNGEELDLEDNNILFKAKDQNVCFIPTRDGLYSCSVKDGVLDDDCIGIITGALPECGNIEWERILQEYETKKCKISKYTCKAESFPCQCFSAGNKDTRKGPETCSEREPYCYDGKYGCFDKGPDWGDNLQLCKETNQQFELSQPCIVDENTCQVKNAPCSCHTQGSNQRNEMPPHVCNDGQYCYNEQIGCSNEIPSKDKSLYSNYCRNSNKKLS